MTVGYSWSPLSFSSPDTSPLSPFLLFLFLSYYYCNDQKSRPCLVVLVHFVVVPSRGSTSGSHARTLDQVLRRPYFLSCITYTHAQLGSHFLGIVLAQLLILVLTKRSASLVEDACILLTLLVAPGIPGSRGQTQTGEHASHKQSYCIGSCLVLGMPSLSTPEFSPGTPSFL